jgi:hypothetical protein
VNPRPPATAIPANSDGTDRWIIRAVPPTKEELQQQQQRQQQGVDLRRQLRLLNVRKPKSMKKKREQQEALQQQLQQLKQQQQEIEQQWSMVNLFELYEEAVRRKGLPNPEQDSSVWDELAESGVAGLTPKAVTGEQLRQVRVGGGIILGFCPR